MKKQVDRTLSATQEQSAGENGDKRAQADDMLDSSPSSLNGDSVHPIDTLLVQQLENLLNGERALRAHYASLEPSMDSAETRLALSAELFALKDRTDRLFRLMNAMDSYGTPEGAGEEIRTVSTI